MDRTPNHTRGQIEDGIAKEVTKFYAAKLGVGPRETRVHILQDMVIIRLKGKLLPVEKILLEHEGGISMVKDLRKAIHEQTVSGLSSIINQTTGQTVVSSHSDISTKTGEIVQVYILGEDLEEILQTRG